MCVILVTILYCLYIFELCPLNFSTLGIGNFCMLAIMTVHVYSFYIAVCLIEKCSESRLSSTPPRLVFNFESSSPTRHYKCKSPRLCIVLETCAFSYYTMLEVHLLACNNPKVSHFCKEHWFSH